MILKIENSKEPGDMLKENVASGIGLQNVKKRLELIYPHRFDLQIMNEEESFLVILRLELERNKAYTKQPVEELQEKWSVLSSMMSRWAEALLNRT